MAGSTELNREIDLKERVRPSFPASARSFSKNGKIVYCTTVCLRSCLEICPHVAGSTELNREIDLKERVRPSFPASARSFSKNGKIVYCTTVCPRSCLEICPHVAGSTELNREIDLKERVRPSFPASAWSFSKNWENSLLYHRLSPFVSGNLSSCGGFDRPVPRQHAPSRYSG